MTKALTGVKILDFTHVQSGPTCTQLLAWFGADVIKVERPGVGDITRGQLQDIPNVDSLYFTMLNHNKRSITLDTKNPKGKEVLTALIKTCDVLVENFGPGALDRMGFTWERIQELNPKMILASVKGFSDGHHYEDLKVYENVAQCAGGAASTTGFWDGPPTVSAAALGDSNTGMHLAIGILTALRQRDKTGKGQKVACSMQDAVLNLCRVKLRDQQRLDRTGVMQEYPQYPDKEFGDAVPRAGNASGGGQPGWILKCKGWETDPNAYIYFITQAPVWKDICKVIGREEWRSLDVGRTVRHLDRIAHREVFAARRVIDLDDGAGLAQRRFVRDLFHRENRSARDVVLVEDVHRLELGLRLRPCLDPVEDFRQMRQPRLRRRVPRIGQPFLAAYHFADGVPDRRLGDEVDVRVGVGLPALALENPSGLPAARGVPRPRGGIAERAVGVLRVLLEDMRPCEPLLIAQLHAAQVEHAILHRGEYALTAARGVALVQGRHDPQRKMQSGSAVADLRTGDERRAVIEAGRGRRTTGTLRDVLVDFAVFVRPGAEALDRRHDHARVELTDALP